MNADRRQFAKTALGSLVAYGFIESCWNNGLFAESVKPTIEKWLKDLVTMTQDLRGRKLLGEEGSDIETLGLE